MDTHAVITNDSEPRPAVVTETFGYTRGDLSAAGRAVMLSSWPRRASTAILVVLLPLAPLVGVGGSAYFGLVAGTAAVLLATLFPGVLQSRGTTAGIPRRFEFSDAGIAVYEAGSESTRDWSTVTRVQRIRGRRLLFVSKRQAIVIPDRVLSQEGQAQLDQLIADHVSSPSS